MDMAFAVIDFGKFPGVACIRHQRVSVNFYWNSPTRPVKTM